MDWRAVEGWFSDADAEALRALLSRVPVGGSTAHVGVFQGRHLAACADVIRERSLSVVAIDTWAGTPGLQNEAVGGWAAVAIGFGQAMARCDFGGPVGLVPLDSLRAADLFADAGRRFDLVFLDADHGYRPLCRDIAAWRPLVKPGGILCGHDYGDEAWPGVARAVDELLPGALCWPGSKVWHWTDGAGAINS